MQLVYFDESGNSGNNLNDPRAADLHARGADRTERVLAEVGGRPRFLAGRSFPGYLERRDGNPRLRPSRSRGVFKGVPVAARIGLRDAWLEVGAKPHSKFVYRSIEKKSYQKWLHATFGVGVSINPHIAAFALVAVVVNEYLTDRKTLGIFISDENKEIVRDVEKSIRQLRLSAGPLRLSQIIEKGFFIDSTKSRILQLCDVCVLQAREKEEEKAGLPPRAFDIEGIKLIEPLVHRGNEGIRDVLERLKKEQTVAGRNKSSGQGVKPGVGYCRPATGR